MRKIEGLLLDMDGVLYVGDKLIDGALDALQDLRKREVPFRFITNTTTRSPESLLDKLADLGIEAQAEEVFTAVTATRNYLESRGDPSCYLLLREEAKTAFKRFDKNDHDPDYVVIGDIGARWDYDTLNDVFNMLMRGAGLICMHRNKFWQGEEGLRMDIGAFVAALEYVSDKEAIVIGKPSSAFFEQAIGSLGLSHEKVAIVGDDIDSDVGGGQASGLSGVLVKTGKYRQNYVSRSSIRPDATIGSIADLPGLLDKKGR